MAQKQMKQFKKNLQYWLPTLAWMSLIFYMSSMQAVSTSEVYWQDFTVKKAAHFVEYFILGMFMYRSVKNTTKLSPAMTVFLTIIMCGFYAISDEVHQSFIPGREPHLRDVTIDILGSSVAVLIFSQKLPQKLTRKP